MSRLKSTQRKLSELGRALGRDKARPILRHRRKLTVESLEPRRLLAADITLSMPWGQFCIPHQSEWQLDGSAAKTHATASQTEEQNLSIPDVPQDSSDFITDMSISSLQKIDATERIAEGDRIAERDRIAEGDYAGADTPTVHAPSIPQVVGSFVYHRGSVFSNDGVDGALDSGTTLAKEGSEPQTLGFSNLVNGQRGINGIAFDVANLNSTELHHSDFRFQMSPEGAFNELDYQPSQWEAAPVPELISVEKDEQTQISRIRIEWPDGAIMNRWLRLTIEGNDNTGLPQSEVFYLGHLIGKTTNWLVDQGENNPSGVFEIHMVDIMMIRQQVGTLASVDSVYDINKDGVVSFRDIAMMRPYLGVRLSNITVAAVPDLSSDPL